MELKDLPGLAHFFGLTPMDVDYLTGEELEVFVGTLRDIEKERKR